MSASVQAGAIGSFAGVAPRKAAFGPLRLDSPAACFVLDVAARGRPEPDVRLATG